MPDPTPRTAPYGTWSSPLDGATVATSAVPLGEIAFDGEAVVWSQSRPAENGRSTVLRRHADGAVEELLAAPWDARTSVHEYGGGAWAVRDGVLAFAQHDDQRLYLRRPGRAPEPLTPPSDGRLRYGDLRWDADRWRLLAVREDHRGEGREPVNTLVAVPLDGGPHEGTVLAEGCDFYAAPRPSPDGDRLAWIEWDHPHMPWDATRLRRAEVAPDGTLGATEVVAGGLEEAVQQPRFLPDGALAFVSDASGWWNPYLERSGQIVPLHSQEDEFGGPMWTLGLTTLEAADARTLVTLFGRGRPSRLGVLDAGGGGLRELPLPGDRMLTDLSVGPDGASVVTVASAPTRPDELIRVDLATGSREVLATAGPLPVGRDHLSDPETIAIPSEEGRTAIAHVYPPTNPEHVAPEGELPPLLVTGHGGPTGCARLGLDLGIQFWTSRGFAVADVDYGGSSGYGRTYRQLLDGRWGQVDVDDLCAAARHLAADGRADPDRLAVRGRSAGGYTTLAALAFRDVFHAGASIYGVSDLEALTRETHKFESRYLERLVAPYPEGRAVYRARSPVHHAHRMSCPVIFLQGDRDAVVPPDQAQRMIEALHANGVPTAYLLFEGEAHGFRRADTVRRALEAELSFYAQVFAFEPAGGIEPVPLNRP